MITFRNAGYGVVVRRGKFLSPQAKQFLEIMNPRFFEEFDNNYDIGHDNIGTNIENPLLLP